MDTRNPIHSATWIWCDENVDALNQYALFRRGIDLPAEAGRVLIHACADMRYWLFVNGRRVGFGPGRYNPRFPQYDTHDVTPLVRPGVNQVAFKVHSIGFVPTITSFVALRAGLIAAVEWDGGCVVSDENWRALRETAYAPDTPRFSAHQSFIECFDARRSQDGWQTPSFDDSAWPHATGLPPDKLAPWEELVPRPIPLLTRMPRTANRILETGVSEPKPEYNPADMKTLAAMLETSCRRPGEGVAPDPQSLYPVRFTAPVDSRQAAYAVFDFAENSAGYLCFTLEGTPGTVVDFGYSESFRDGAVESNKQTVRYADRLILGAKPVEHQLMFPKCLRYLLVEVRGGSAALKALRQDVSTYPVEWRGGFVCREEPSLQRVWQIGAHTVQLCMEDIYVDTPRRERSGWLGDLVPEAMAAYYAFGETKLARHALSLFMSSQQPEGYLSGRYPGRDLVNMPTFSASFAPALADYVRHSGDIGFAAEMGEGIDRLTGWFEGQRGPDDLLVVLPAKQTDKARHRGYILIDWAPGMRDGAVTAMNACYYQHLREAAWLARALGKGDDAARYLELAGRTKRAIQAGLFDERRGIYVNCRDGKGLSKQAGTQDNILALLWDIATPEQARSICRAMLPDDSPFPLYDNPDPANWVEMGSGLVTWPHDSLVPIGSPFFFYFALDALFKIGRTQAALNNIRQHYGGLLAEGATTVWEEWSGVSSQSHGWGAAPTVFLGRYVLGVEPIEPGFRTFGVYPSPGGLARCGGRVPSPHGTIDVAWEKTPDGMTMRVTVPPGTTAKAGLPTNGPGRLFVNGVSCPAENVVLLRGAYAGCVLEPGRHTITLSGS